MSESPTIVPATIARDATPFSGTKPIRAWRSAVYVNDHLLWESDAEFRPRVYAIYYAGYVARMVAEYLGA